jgi:tripartite-type tricarboxylate transporter receptor subunit TctC
MELLAQSAGTAFQHVPFRGGAEALKEVLGKRIDLMIDPPTIMVEHVKSGAMRFLAVTTASRARALPEVPTVAEAGFKDFDVPGWFGIVGPAGLPAAIVSKLNAEITATLRESEVGERIRALGSEPSPSTPEKLKARLSSDVAKWNKVIDVAKIERI